MGQEGIPKKEYPKNEFDAARGIEEGLDEKKNTVGTDPKKLAYPEAPSNSPEAVKAEQKRRLDKLLEGSELDVDDRPLQ